jgi:hypothetical protein
MCMHVVVDTLGSGTDDKLVSILRENHFTEQCDERSTDSCSSLILLVVVHLQMWRGSHLSVSVPVAN